MTSVLFVCRGNRYRSPIAAACFQRRLEQIKAANDWMIGSAGTWTEGGLSLDQKARKDAKKLGLNLNDHRTRSINLELLSRYDLILVMESGQKEAIQLEFPSVREKVHLLSEVVDGIAYDIPDPLGSDETTRQDIAVELSNLIERGFNKICGLAQHR